jgi:hypothetical protein
MGEGAEATEVMEQWIEMRRAGYTPGWERAAAL